MLGSRKPKTAEVLSHWYTVMDHFNISSKEFYSAVERELERRQVPGLKISRVIFSEGGILTANREYLRMKRERLIFDICAAPFGTSYFFSMRFAELPLEISWSSIFLSLLAIAFLSVSCMFKFGIVGGSMIGLVALVLAVGYAGNLRRETYYTQDTRLMYLEIVNSVVKQRVAEFTSAGGFHLLSIHQHSPLMDDLYRTSHMRLETVETPASLEPVTA